MSVAPLTAGEFGTFVAIAHKIGKGSIADLAAIAEMMSRSNAAAYSAQYNEQLEPATANEIEHVASRLVEQDELLGHFGPIVYNCVTNAGELYYGELPAGANNTAALADVETWSRIEKAAKQWQDGKQREFERAEQNAVAFDEVGRLPLKTADELKQLMADGALIVATFGVNESESQSDYFGGRTARRVVIGVRKGKRESFKALRKAAGNFPPTAEYGPGKDVFTANVVMTSDVPNGNGCAYWKGSRSHWHNELGHGTTFTTQAEAEAFVAKAGEPHAINFDGTLATFAWSIDRESVEHRENWSMGGGNYLGTSRYGGWKVSSTNYVNGPMEFWAAKK